ncbi:glycosyltransferase family 2 protein [Hymenobacter sp. B81]|uniref:glycosyltransferase family 2 protein n=1 Tax=Hymenobacter sp. B81 TaxID=3344878 RepID=UPI0037DD4EA0
MPHSFEPLSCYVLTRNAEKYLGQVLAAIRPVADDLLIVDSGSTDATLDIARQHGARIVTRPFDNFREQRRFADSQCQHTWTLALDADEVPSPAFVQAIQMLKRNHFNQQTSRPDAFQFERVWYVMGQRVHAYFPVSSPDYPTRLLNRAKVGYADGTDAVHAGPSGHERVERIEGVVQHYSCDSVDELFGKLNHYTTMAARDLARRGKRATWLKRTFSPWGAWLKWYLRKGNWRDGTVGRLMGHYAYEYSYQKYQKLYFDQRPPTPAP